jgi:hypothetical protein
MKLCCYVSRAALAARDLLHKLSRLNSIDCVFVACRINHLQRLQLSLWILKSQITQEILHEQFCIIILAWTKLNERKLVVDAIQNADKLCAMISYNLHKFKYAYFLT